VLADDHSLVREGLALLLNSTPGIELVGQAGDGDELLSITKKLGPDVAIVDLRMPVKTGIEALREINSWKEKPRCMAISMFENEYKIVEALEAGAIGYITKQATKDEFLEAVHLLYRNIPYYCKTTSVKLAKLLGRSHFNPYAPTGYGKIFTAIEEQIIRLICREFSSIEIAKELFMGKRNVDLHRVKILRKMNVKTTAGVAIYAIKHNIVSLDDLDGGAVDK